ncbi:MAG: Wzt carbohydrate-binding domain-containing protein, partial [Candidatus Paceibacterota bacterium]
VDFSGVERYIDTPVKRYSSGMHVRLAFSVAAHLDPEIMVVDEVLAVGDAEFQKKAIGKMQDSSSKLNRTVLFVSHNMSSIESLCSRTILLKDGKIVSNGDTQEIVSQYLRTITEQTKIDLSNRKDRRGTGNIQFKKMIFEDGVGPNSYAIGNNIHIKVIAKNHYKQEKKVRFSISINTPKQLNLISCDSDLLGKFYFLPSNDEVSFSCVIKNPPLNIGEYLVNIALYVDDIPEDWIVGAGLFSIETGRFDSRERVNHMPVLSQFEWIIN